MENLSPRKLGLVDGIAGGVLGNMLMYFSIQLTDETILDLRYLPVMLTMLFIGVFPGFISTLLIIVGRFMIGSNISSIAALILMISLFLGFYLIVKKMDSSKGIIKKSLTMIGLANIEFTFMLFILVHNKELLFVLIPIFWVISTIGGLISIYVYHYLKRSHTLLKKYEKQSSTDFLTGLNNVRQFDDVWNQLVVRAKEKNERLSLLLLDIDFFKKVNDKYGHPVGDIILKELGEVLLNSTRSFDTVSRNGGEEFSVILPDCPNHQAIEIAERIRRAVEKHPFPISQQDHINITVSIGVATFPETIKNTEQIIKYADECLYKAKRMGRNQVCH
ncbi:GGDEF domain-containing protein [Sutcliffiella halmapala]|uniref:GGDEF domain-containing protein n=1 Tax=Sutcliffiella halmapala TaxID=79882 RepID=UPI001F479A6A|nr:diguanylate cyclase [Sutcliffiella halmapala]